ncbi:hypothetical protein FA13DRAFT_1714500 [Coprinellus micaceus]|uniref:Uncharacterized protein n=1 Tax=Coprinellus micaceus TaxID=71717 RepID=A0A4Y7SST2_COPMI|nr:hypothetical protein FA13DRAFT_1714500 [Coprinellus micaceus]
MPLFSRKRSAFSFKRDANGAYDIKDDKSAHRDFKFTSNPFMGTSMTYQTDGEPRKPTAHTTPRSSSPTIPSPPTRRSTASSVFDAYNLPSSPGPYHSLERSLDLRELFRRIWTLVRAWFGNTPPPLPFTPLTPLSPISSLVGERAVQSQSCPGGFGYFN